MSSVFVTSLSHQCLCSSSFFCSSMRWKIIFSIMFLIWSKVPDPGICLPSFSILSASFDNAMFLPPFTLRRTAIIPVIGALCLRTCTALSWVKVGVMPLSSGARTPVTFSRISMADRKSVV